MHSYPPSYACPSLLVVARVRPEARDDAHDLLGETIEPRDKDLGEGLEVSLLVGREAAGGVDLAEVA